MDSEFEGYINQLDNTKPSASLTREVVEAMGGAGALKSMCNKFSRGGVNAAYIDEEWGLLYMSWNHSCVDILRLYKDECVCIAKAWFLQWGTPQDAIKVIVGLINKDIENEVKIGIFKSQNADLESFEYYRDSGLIASYDEEDILFSLSLDDPLTLVEQDLRLRVAIKFVNCVCVAICSYYSGYLLQLDSENRIARQNKLNHIGN